VRGVAGDNDSLVQAARRRLQLWNVTEEQIERLEKTQKAEAQVTLHSDASGFVTMRNAFTHQKVTPDTELYTVADLSRVWVLASVFENDAPLVRIGQAATVILPATNRRIHGRVSYIQPQIEAATRTLQVRLELPNPGLALKPEMFVDVELAQAQSQRLTVPAEAVLDSGARKTVFVAAGHGWFEPREVETGQRLGDRIEILRGLNAGQRIVASGVFLINSESQLKAAASGMGAPQGAAPAPAPAAGGAHQHD
jgi:RND family efflux transporter MFP subunit